MEETEHHSLLEKGDNSWCHFRPTDEGDKSYTPGVLGELETTLGDRQRGRYTGENRKTEEHIVK